MSNNYWDDVYNKKNETDVSWFQVEPKKSLELIDELHLPANATIIDVGGGDSRLVDNLLSRGFRNISVLDISSISLQKLQHRLENQAENVNFICSDITTFKPTIKYNLWHDRATFHFLTEIEQIEQYLKIAYKALEVGGYLIISTFSKTGPEKCSGLTISKYSEEQLKELFGRYFENIKCFEDTHVTPWGSKQDFVYCGFVKK
jgi:ubiquinone/menaquinone biosynthesis C-methylase UbiE